MEKSGAAAQKKRRLLGVLSPDECGNPRYLKMRVTENIKRTSVRKFAQSAFAEGFVIRSDGYRSYILAKAFSLGTYHGLPKKNSQSYLDECSFCLSRRFFGGGLLERLAIAVGASVRLS